MTIGFFSMRTDISEEELSYVLDGIVGSDEIEVAIWDADNIHQRILEHCLKMDYNTLEINPASLDTKESLRLFIKECSAILAWKDDSELYSLWSELAGDKGIIVEEE